MTALLIIVFCVCLVAAIIMAANKQQPEAIEEKPTLQPKARKKRTQKVRSYEEHQKRMNKKAYLSKNSEYVSVSTSELQELVKPGDKDVVDMILDALLDGSETVKIERSKYNKLRNDGKILS